jgi:predicted Zn-dependent protease
MPSLLPFYFMPSFPPIFIDDELLIERLKFKEEKTMLRLFFRGPSACFLILVGVAMFISSCALGPGEMALQPVEKDREIGLKLARQIDVELGIVKDTRAASYLNSVGERLVHVETDQRFHYSFHIVDQYEPNAFAAPGGWIYITRGMLMLINNEDELANIIGHEMIHVTRRHAARQKANATLPAILSIPGRIVGGIISKDLGNLINAPINLLGAAYIAQHSQADEHEADQLGQKLSASAGYDPGALAPVLVRLQRFLDLKTEVKRMPGFFDTHPSTPDRVERVTTQAGRIVWRRQPGVVPSLGEYMHQLEGLLIGENPAEGVFHGSQFFHADLDFTITVSEGWKAVNTRRAVVALAPKGDGLLSLGIIGQGTDPARVAEALTDAMEKEHGATPTTSQPMEIGKIPAYLVTYKDKSGKQPVDLIFVYLSYQGLIYHFFGMALEHHRSTILEVAQTFRPLTYAERTSIKEMRLHIVSAQANETLARLSTRTRNVWDEETTAVVNGISADQTLKQGRLIKIAVSIPYRGIATTD